MHGDSFVPTGAAGRPYSRSRLAMPLAGGLALIVVLSAVTGTTAQSRLAALPVQAPAPSDNPTTPERVALGRALFWDPILSGQKDVACATCHHPDFGYADGLDLSIGVNGVGLGAGRSFDAGHPQRLVKRNSQTVLNVAFNGLSAGSGAGPAEAPMFWDLRTRGLEAQALEPLKALEEMRGDAYPEDRALREVVARLRGDPGISTTVRARVRRQHRRSARATSGVRSRHFSARWSPRTRRSIDTCAATRQRSPPTRSEGWSGSSRSAVSTATTARCSPTSPHTCSPCPTIGN